MSLTWTCYKMSLLQGTQNVILAWCSKNTLD